MTLSTDWEADAVALEVAGTLSAVLLTLSEDMAALPSGACVALAEITELLTASREREAEGELTGTRRTGDRLGESTLGAASSFSSFFSASAIGAAGAEEVASEAAATVAVAVAVAVAEAAAAAGVAPSPDACDSLGETCEAEAS